MEKKTFTLRLEPELHNFLETESKRQGISRNDYIRNLIKREKEGDKPQCIYAEYFERMKEIDEKIDIFNESMNILEEYVELKKGEKK